MTEDEAKAKWCPFARVEGDGRNMEVVNGYTVPAVFCIGSACMAWRLGARQLFRNSATGALTERDLTGNGQWVYVDGFCGLAGAPQ